MLRYLSLQNEYTITQSKTKLDYKHHCKNRPKSNILEKIIHIFNNFPLILRVSPHLKPTNPHDHQGKFSEVIDQVSVRDVVSGMQVWPIADTTAEQGGDRKHYKSEDGR